MREINYGGSVVSPQVRTLGDMIEFLCDRDSITMPSGTPLYYMYRDLALSRGDRALMKSSHLRYDITIIPPRMLGREYVKTAGHYHPIVPGTDLSYTELYEVLEGTAHYLLQKEEGGVITDVILVEAKKGDKVIIPPNYGHVTINPSNKELKMSNLVSDRFESIYGPYKERRGAAYYELAGGLEKNTAYGQVPEVRRVKAKRSKELGLGRDEEIYSLVRKGIDRLDFLNTPQKHSWLFGLY